MNKDEKITIRVSSMEKKIFQDYCNGIGVKPSEQLRYYIKNINNSKQSSLSVNEVNKVNMIFKQLNYLLNSMSCESKNEILMLLNELENIC